MALRLAPILKKLWVKRVLSLFGVALALFVLVNYAVLPFYVNQQGTLPVPNVTGLTLDQARSALSQVGLEPVLAETRPIPDEPPGNVVFQNPVPQSIVKQGRRIYLTVSGGEVLVVVPQLRGRSMRDAKFALERFGLKLGAVSFEASSQFPENTIVAQSIPAESNIAKGSRVAISVSSGAAGGGVQVPNVVGKTATEAEKILTAVGLAVGNISTQPSYELIPNTVVEQFPRAGEAVVTGQRVDLFVVKGGKPTEEIRVPGR
jgi:beta-lactam-binding protein with PASTA domain